MTPTLGQRAKASKGWRWVAGMRVLLRSYSRQIEGDCIVAGWGEPYGVRVDEDGRPPEPFRASLKRDTDGDIEVVGPDFSDPATASLLPYLGRAAWGIDDLSPCRASEPTEEGRRRLAQGPQWGVPLVHGWRLHKPRTAKEQYIDAKVGLQPSEVEWWIAAIEVAP